MEDAAKSILSNAVRLVGKEIQQLRSVGCEVERLKDELATMNALLRMQSEAQDGAVDPFVREWMKQLRDLAYDAEDCVHLYIFHIKSKPKHGVFVWCKRQYARLVPRHRLAGEIRALRDRAIEIGERHARYGVGRDALSGSSSSAPVPLLEGSAHVPLPTNNPLQLVSFTAQATELVTKLRPVAGQARSLNLKVFSIVGFGGLGKTTLAMEVCRQLETDFPCQAIVSVSQAFSAGRDMPLLLRSVLKQVDKAKSPIGGAILQLSEIDKLDDGQVAEKLQEILQNNRYLIVIDDVWTISAWDAIQSKLPTHKNGSRIIVTTRLDSVAKECSEPAVGIHSMGKLSFDDSKILFKRRAFGENDPTFINDFNDIMAKIIKKCGGLPLAIISIASLLARYVSPGSQTIWDTIFKSIGSQIDSSPTLAGLKQIITLSYNHLPYNLKGCMMYLSLFPEDYEIKTSRLLYRWIAEGLVEQTRGWTLMEVAESYFDELISRSMIVPTSDIGYTGRTMGCRVHDMLLEVMVSKSLEANFVSLVGAPYEGVSYDRIRRLSVHDETQAPVVSSSKKKSAWQGKSNDIEGMNMKHVRSLSIFEIQGHNFLNRLAEFTLMRVLDLEGCKGLENKHVEHICKMYLLRFLSLRSTAVSVLPKEIGELEQLQMINVDSTPMKELPREVTKLERLENVDFRNKDKWFIMWTPPPGLSKMKALREVNYMIIDDVEVAQDVGKLENLRQIGIWVNPGNQAVHQELARSLSKTSSLRSLNIGCFREGPLNFLRQMESPPRLLRYLFLDGVINQLPSWVGSLGYLTDFNIMNTRLLEEDAVFGVLCNLPSLQRIWLGPSAYIGDEMVARTAHNFPELRKLLYSCADTVQNLHFEAGSMDTLEELSIDFGTSERTLTGISNLGNLKKAELIGFRRNRALKHAVEQLIGESTGRAVQSRFKVLVRYE